MPREVRKKSKSGMYHIILRGVNRQDIFYEETDKQKFLSILLKQQLELHFSLYAYCLMDNHVHILIKENLAEIDKLIKIKELRIKDSKVYKKELDFNLPSEPTIDLIMKKIASSYAVYFNKSYGRVGHLFQERYKSEPVENERQFLVTLRYIHQNPMKAGIIANCKYKFSSYNDLLNSYEGVAKFVEWCNTASIERFPDYIKSYFPLSSLFDEFMNEYNDDKLMDIDKKKFSDGEVKDLFIKEGLIENFGVLKTLDVLQKVEIAKFLANKYSISINQLERVTGIGRHFLNQNLIRNQRGRGNQADLSPLVQN